MREFRTLHQLLDEQERDHLNQIEEAKKKITRKKDEHLDRFYVELSTMDSQIREMEEKCQQPASELLQVRL